MPSPGYLLADDLSGGLEAGASFHAAGYVVAMPLAGDPGSVSTPASAVDLVALNTGTRAARPQDARAIVRRTADRLARTDCPLVYKKVDSTLRGPIGGELDALLALRPGLNVVICPATPDAGRTVRDGVLYVRGKPVAETAFARDPLWPVTDSRIDRVLRGECAATVAHISLEALRAGGAADALAAAFSAGSRIAVADAESAEDLNLLVRALSGQRQPVLPVGSGGLARAVARAGRVPKMAGQPPVVSSPVARGICLFVCGSAHEVNRRQASVLCAEAGLERVSVPVRAASEATTGIACVADRAAAAAERAGGAILMLETSELPAISSAAELRAVSARLTGRLGEIARRVDERRRVSQVFVTGGETARAVLEALQGRWLRLVDEIEQGMAAARVTGPGGDRLAVTKPGGFGDARTMLHAWRWFRTRQAGGQGGHNG